MAGWLKPAIREHRWRGNLLPGFESQSPACRRLAGSASTRRAASLGRNAGIKCLDRERRIPHRTPRFRDWAAEETDHPREVIEPALAHDVRNPVDAAYARSDLFERRRRPSYTLYSQRTSLHSGSSAREGPVGDDEDLVALHGLGVAIGRPMPIIRLLAPAADYSSSNRRSAPAGHRKGPGSRRATGS